MSFFPILLDLDGLPCLVAGGGRLGLHKAKLLLEHGADVTVVAPEACPELAALPVRLRRRTVAAQDVAGMALVVDATGDEAAQRLLSDACRRAHIPFNSACRVDDGSAIFPAVHRQGRTVLAVSTLGASPIASTRVRDALAARLPERMDEILDAMAALRPVSREAFPEQTRRRDFLRRCLEEMLALSRPLTGAEIEAITRRAAEQGSAPPPRGN